MEQPDLLREEYTIDTPENVSFGYDIAGIGSRYIGALIDSAAVGALLFLVNLAIFALLAWVDTRGGALPLSDADVGDFAGGLLIGLYALLNFAVLWGYFLLFELLWNGQTPGKRLAGLRVVRMDGTPAGFTEVAIRNLVRIVDFFPAGYTFGLAAMLCNRQARRLGDYAAGTVVIRQRDDVTLARLMGTLHLHLTSPSTPPPRHLPGTSVPAVPGLEPAALRALSAGDYQLVVAVLERRAGGTIDEELVHRLARAVAARLQVGAPADLPGASHRFLQEVATRYRLQGHPPGGDGIA